MPFHKAKQREPAKIDADLYSGAGMQVSLSDQKSRPASCKARSAWVMVRLGRGGILPSASLKSEVPRRDAGKIGGGGPCAPARDRYWPPPSRGRLMNPNDILIGWLVRESEDVQRDVAFLVGRQLLGDDIDILDEERSVRQLIDWLSARGEGKYRIVGKVLSFIAVFEYACGDRFTAEGWGEPGGPPEGGPVGGSDNEVAVMTGKPSADLQKQIAAWGKVGQRWNAARGRISTVTLRDWAFGAGRNSID